MITVRDLAKHYDNKEALRGVSFTLNPGEITAILGPNGAGKSTTVKMIAGLLRPTSGQVSVGGFDLQTHPLEAKRLLGYVPENSALYSTLTPIEYLSLVAELHHVPEKVARERINQLFQLFELRETLSRQIETLSRGQRQKVLLSGAFLHDPSVLLLDEPLQGLDANAVVALRRTLESFVEHGKTILFCSHILDVVQRLCRRVLVLCDGRLIADDTMENLLKQCASGTLEAVFCKLTRTEDAEEGTQAFLREFAGSSIKEEV